MKSISISDLSESRLEGRIELAATVQSDNNSERIWFRTAQVRVSPLADPFVPTVLVPAMHQRLPLSVDGPVSPGILRSAQRVQLVKSVWDTSLVVVPIEAQTTVTPSRESNRAVGAFFSGGVDSFYTLKRHEGEITHLIFVHGFDIPLHRLTFREQMAGELRRIARTLNLEMVEVETNLRGYSDRYVSWDDVHGAARLTPRTRSPLEHGVLGARS